MIKIRIDALGLQIGKSISRFKVSLPETIAFDSRGSSFKNPIAMDAESRAALLF
jgi:hypothetical protein